MTNKPEEYEKRYLYHRIVRAKLFIDVHYSENIDISEIANEAYFSRFHFIRVFKSIYGKTPHHYLTQVRIEKAKQMLIQNKSISEVSLAVGFESATSFAGVFKKINGTSPSAFQQIQLLRNIHIQSDPLRFIPNCFAETSGWNRKAILER